MVICPSCGTANGPTAKFCSECATPLAAAPTPPREERRTVTVLFADLASFTARAEALDPEDVRAFLHPWYELLEREVAGHGGTVERHLGDGILALFGAPVAHEDDPERAVRAALRITERLPGLGLDLHARIGINTGPVLFAAATGPGREDAVTGDAVNTAARLQAAAPVDAVVVGEATFQATSHVFAYKTVEPVVAKGKTEPVHAWRPIAPVARVVGELTEETTPFVGRDLELRTLIDRFERARTTPALEVVTIVADPGLGKSRLVRELARYVDALPDLVTWRVGRCLPYGEGIGFWALGEIVKAQAGILDTDDQVTLSVKLDAAITEPDPSLRRWLTQRLAPLVGLETTAEPPQQVEAYTAWRRFLESIVATGPLVLIVEDLHWADDALVAFLTHLVDRTTGQPILLVATARPEIEERHPAWLERTEALRIAPLGDTDIRTLLAAALPDASPELLAAVLERAAGSPLYAEQLATMARDRPEGAPLDEAAIPPTIAALLASRIDMLPPDKRAVLLDASVVGKTFWSGAVATLGGRGRSDVEALLVDLARRDLVRSVHPSSMANEQEYAFVHALLCDTAYGELTRASRLAHHRSIAVWITERAGQALGEHAGIVADHYGRALELAETLGARDALPGLRDGLREALLTGARHAMGTRPSGAVDRLRRALGLLAPDDPSRPGVLIQLGRALLAVWDSVAAAQVLEEALAILRARGDTAAVAEMAWLLATAQANTGHSERAEAILAEAHAVLAGTPSPGLMKVTATQAGFAVRASNGELAMSLAEDAIQLASDVGLPPPARAIVIRGMARFRTDPSAGEADFRDAIAYAEAEGDLEAAAIAVFDLGATTAEILGPVAGLVAVDEGVTYLEAHGIPTEAIWGLRLECLLQLGQWDAVMEAAEPLEAWATSHGDSLTLSDAQWALTLVRLERGYRASGDGGRATIGLTGGPLAGYVGPAAEALLQAGNEAAARDLLRLALDARGQHEVPYLANLVRACLRAGAPELARRALGLGPTSCAVYAAEMVAAEAIVAEAAGDLASAREGYAQAAAELARLGYVYELAYALVGLGRCLLALGETEEGVARLREARELWIGMKATPRIAEIDALLATVA